MIGLLTIGSIALIILRKKHCVSGIGAAQRIIYNIGAYVAHRVWQKAVPLQRKS